MLEVGRGAPAAEGHHEEDDVMEAAVGGEGAAAGTPRRARRGARRGGGLWVGALGVADPAADEVWGGDVVLEEEALGLRDGLEEGEEGVFVAGGETADENLGAVAEGDGL